MIKCIIGISICSVLVLSGLLMFYRVDIPGRPLVSYAITTTILRLHNEEKVDFPIIEWEDGQKRLWNATPVEIRVFGMSDKKYQSQIMAALSQAKKDYNVPVVDIMFFDHPHVSSETKPPRLVKRVFLK